MRNNQRPTAAEVDALLETIHMTDADSPVESVPKKSRPARSESAERKRAIVFENVQRLAKSLGIETASAFNKALKERFGDKAPSEQRGADIFEGRSGGQDSTLEPIAKLFGVSLLELKSPPLEKKLDKGFAKHLGDAMPAIEKAIDTDRDAVLADASTILDSPANVLFAFLVHWFRAKIR